MRRCLTMCVLCTQHHTQHPLLSCASSANMLVRSQAAQRRSSETPTSSVMSRCATQQRDHTGESEGIAFPYTVTTPTHTAKHAVLLKVCTICTVIFKEFNIRSFHGTGAIHDNLVCEHNIHTLYKNHLPNQWLYDCKNNDDWFTVLFFFHRVSTLLWSALFLLVIKHTYSWSAYAAAYQIWIRSLLLW